MNDTQNREMQAMYLCGRQQWRPWKSWPMSERRAAHDFYGPGSHHRRGVAPRERPPALRG